MTRRQIFRRYDRHNDHWIPRRLSGGIRAYRVPPHKTKYKEDYHMAKYEWHPIEEMDLDDGTHTCYATTDHDGRYIWLTQISDDTWDVEIATGKGDSSRFVTMANCKTLTSAKRWVSRYWFRNSRWCAERYPT